MTPPDPTARAGPTNPAAPTGVAQSMARRLARRLLVERAAWILCALALTASLSLFVWILGTALFVGGPHFVESFTGVGTPPTAENPSGFGLAPTQGTGSTGPPLGFRWGDALMGSIAILAMALGLGVPAGVGVGIYMAELGRGVGGRGVRLICEALVLLPSLVLGFAVWSLLVATLDVSVLLAGAASLALVLIPMVAVTTDEALGAVPQGVRDGALALGLGEAARTLQVVFPAAAARVGTGVLVASGRLLGETAPLVVVVAAGTGFVLGDGRSGVTALPLEIHGSAVGLVAAGGEEAWAGALILLAGIFLLHGVARALWRRRATSPDTGPAPPLTSPSTFPGSRFSVGG